MKVFYIGYGFAEDEDGRVFFVHPILKNEWIEDNEYSEENKDFSIREESNEDKTLIPYEDPNQLNLFK